MSSSSNSDTHIVIIGGGWAGLSAAHHLATTGIASTILEAAPQAGGRARSIKFNNNTVDNGQHLFIGAYKNILQMLAELKIPASKLFHRTNLNINTKDQTSDFWLKLPKIIYPLNIILGILCCKGCSFIDKWLLLKFSIKLKLTNYSIPKDISVQEMLVKNKQSKYLIKYFWEPLALAALTTPITKASARVFLNVIKIAFSYPRKNSDFLFNTKDLSKILPEPVLEHHNELINIKYNSRVRSIEQTKNNDFIIHFGKKTINCKKIILATTAIATHKIVANSNIKFNKDLIKNLKGLSYEPITTIYYELTNKYQDIGMPMHGIISGIGQWMFNRDKFEDNKIISVVISSNYNKENLNSDTLAKLVFQELIRSFSNLPDYKTYKIVTEKRAAFSCTVDIDRKRPKHTTECNNIFLAGDYTNTNLPATLEGAVISGKNCANLIMETI